MKPPSAGRRPIRLQEFAFDASAYELVNRAWMCGKIVEGEICREGPDSRGRCRIGPECLPVREGDRYLCARSQSRGGSCAEGPAPDGGCSHAQTKCQPVRSIRAKRGMVVRMAVAVTVAVLAMLFGGSELREWSEAFVQPGALTAKHGAIADCGSCHAAAGEGSTPGQWLLAAFKPAPGVDSAQCLSCHGGIGENALLAHGVDLGLRPAAGPVIERGPVGVGAADPQRAARRGRAGTAARLADRAEAVLEPGLADLLEATIVLWGHPFSGG